MTALAAGAVGTVEPEGKAGRTPLARGTPGIRRLGLAAVGAAALLALLASFLFVHYRSAHTLRLNLLAQRAQEAQLHAAAVGTLLGSAQAELRFAAASSEVDAFFKNRDLGMSMEYGLRLTLVPLAQRLHAAVDGHGGRVVLSRLALVDEDGTLLAESGPGPGASLRAAGVEGFQLGPEGRELVMVQPFRFKGRVAARLVGSVSSEALAEVLPKDGRSWVRLLDEKGRQYHTAQSAPSPLDRIHGLETVPANGREVEIENGAYFAVRVPVPGQPFTVLQVDRTADLVGSLSPLQSVLGLSAAAMAVLLGAALAFVFSGRSLLLAARLEESLVSRRELEAQHRELRREVAAREKLEEQLRHAQKLEAVGTLAGGVAHDFNNLLSVINGYAAMALTELPDGHAAREELQEILAAGGRAAILTRQLLAFGRRQVLRPEVVDLNDVVSGIEKMLRRLIPENIELVTSRARDLGRVRLDPGQLEQALVNLVVNARDAMPEGGRIQVATADVVISEGDARLGPDAAPGAYVRLSVKDDGAGMDEETRARCFEPFFTTKAPGQGTGLGLSTVYGIVSQSRGFVLVDSAPGRGSTFDLYFPATEEVPVVRTGPAALARPGPARPGETVLVVEDEAQLRELLCMSLTTLGYTVLQAGDGEAALELAGRHAGRIDVLLSDVVMPRMSGPELARSFRARYPGAAVVFMTGYAEEAVARHGALGEGDMVIEKPGGLDSVPAVLRSLLDGGTGVDRDG
jgi:signal transduction histidine kinase/ActR/RegA family two-component response regulator